MEVKGLRAKTVREYSIMGVYIDTELHGSPILEQLQNSGGIREQLVTFSLNESQWP